ncbi:MAG: hypothetical protein AUK43_12615 [Oscillatoriales cyanobacterium CG2_30_40_61]|nr:MAG: hypothetical protein AUK43_12615 [Oscillatoriales cyanobacterium CG2_30_40_61]
MKLGTDIHIVAYNPGARLARGFAAVYDMTEMEIRKYILDFAIEISRESGVHYEHFYGFNLNNKGEIALMFDLTNLNNPIEINDETIQKSTWELVKPDEDDPLKTL